MRFEEVWLSGFDKPVPLESGLTVLFGLNSVGKSTILEAIEAVLSGRRAWEQRRAIPGETTTASDVSLVIRLDPDELWHRDWLLSDHYVQREAAAHANDESLGRQGSFDVARSLALAGDIGETKDRALLAEQVAAVGRWGIQPLSLTLIVRIDDLDAEAARSAIRIATAAIALREASIDGNNTVDSLTAIAMDLADGGRAAVPWANWPRRVTMRTAFGEEISLTPTPTTPSPSEYLHNMGVRLIHVPVEPTNLDGLALTCVTRAYQCLSQPAAEREEPLPASSPAETTKEFRFEIDESAVEELGLEPGWLDILNEPVVITQRNPQLDWWLLKQSDGWTFCVNPTVQAVAALIGRAIAQRVPSFVLDSGTPDVVVTDPRSWGDSSERVAVVMRGSEAEIRSIDSFGAGTRRWVQAALIAVAAHIPHEFLGWEPEVEMWGEDPIDLFGEGFDQLSDLERDLALLESYLIVSGSRDVVLVDEPESHLHPAAAESVAAWISDYAERAGAVVVATHSTQLLKLEGSSVNRVFVRRRERDAELVPLGGSLPDALASDAEALGLSPVDLFLLHRGVVFVEGPHDLAVFEEMVGTEIRTAGVHLVMAHGTQRMEGLLESEVIAKLGFRIGIVVDSDRAGNQAVHRLRREGKRSGRHVETFQLSKPGIEYYLADDVCVSEASSFPGWQKVEVAWKRAGRPDFKKFVRDTYGLPLDRESVRHLARRTYLSGQVPNEIKLVARAIAAWAQGLSLAD